MQSTDRRDKRGSARRPLEAELFLEDTHTGNRLRAAACDYSRSGIRIRSEQPLWPGALYTISPGPGAGGEVVPACMAAVRWCSLIDPPAAAMRYVAGLQFEPVNHRPRPVRRFRVIRGGLTGP